MRHRSPRNVFLIGFMAAGKTRVGRALARRLGKRFVDVDLEVERSAGRTVADIFAFRGETRFRELEARAIARVAGRTGQVVAVGGGAAVFAQNVTAMRRAGVVVYLETPFAIVFERGERSRGPRRPLWRGGTSRERRRVTRLLYTARRGAYRRAADIVLRPGNLPVRAVADRVLLRLLRRGREAA